MLSNQLDNIHKSIIDIHRELFDESPTPMKVQKLCYYAEGYNLGFGNPPLFPENFQAWQHGPVIYPLYSLYKDYQWRSIDEEFMYDPLSEEVVILLKDIVSSYGRYDGAALSTMTHRESPWIEARKGLDEQDSCSNVIPKDSIRVFFENKLKTVAS